MIVERMAAELDLSTVFLLSVAFGASHSYKSYAIPKRNGGTRQIHHPSRRLKALQRWFLTNVLLELPVHPAAKAYRSGLSTSDNASQHASSHYLLRMDFCRFFESITVKDLRAYIAQHAQAFGGWSSADADFFCSIVCRQGALTIGAPTSPAMSNAICFKLDNVLTSLCTEVQVTYTRYADDLFFSTKQAHVLNTVEKQVKEIVSKLDVPAALVINETKTRHSSRRGARRVTGLVLGSDGQVYVGRKLKRRIRALIHKRATLTLTERASLAGLVAYAQGQDPAFINSLITKYGVKAVHEVTRPSNNAHA
jgi:RNA-directed DNA polymerase